MPHISRNIPTISVRHHYPTESKSLEDVDLSSV